MLPNSEIEKLENQRQRLLAESELNRQAIIAEIEHIGDLIDSYTRPTVQTAQTVKPALYALAPIAGYLLMRRWRTARNLGGKLLFLFQILRKAYTAYQFVRSKMA